MRRETPCDFGPCPYAYGPDDYVNCEYWCAEVEPEDVPDDWDDDPDLEVGYDPYVGCYTNDC